MIVVIALFALALTGPADGTVSPHASALALAPVTSPARLAGTWTGSTSVARAPGWDWPLAGRPEVVRPFDPPPVRWRPGHRGVDLAGEPGEPVLAAGAGVVAFAGVVAGRGVVSVDHAGGLRTTYEPVSASVRIGDVVGLGAPLGTLDSGHPGCPTAACLHWGLRRGDVYLNPLLLVQPLRVRLKPLSAANLPGAGNLMRLGQARGWACS